MKHTKKILLIASTFLLSFVFIFGTAFADDTASTTPDTTGRHGDPGSRGTHTPMASHAPHMAM